MQRWPPVQSSKVPLAQAPIDSRSPLLLGSSGGRCLRSGLAWPCAPGSGWQGQCRLTAYPSHPLPVVAVSYRRPAATPPTAMSPVVAMVRCVEYSCSTWATSSGHSNPTDPTTPPCSLPDRATPSHNNSVPGFRACALRPTASRFGHGSDVIRHGPGSWGRTMNREKKRRGSNRGGPCELHPVWPPMARGPHPTVSSAPFPGPGREVGRVPHPIPPRLFPFPFPPLGFVRWTGIRTSTVV